MPNHLLNLKQQKKFQNQQIILEFQDLSGHYKMQNISEIEVLIKLISEITSLALSFETSVLFLH